MSGGKFLKLVAVLGFWVVGGLILLHFATPSNTVQSAMVLPKARPADVFDRYGINLARYDVEERSITRGETFSHILSDYNIDADAAGVLAREARDLVNVRRLRAGDSLRVYRGGGTARMLIYHRDPVNYVVFDLRDTLRVEERQRPVKVEERVLRGVIDGSLYNTLAQLDADPQLASRLADVFRWQVDFYRIQKGDRFAAVYEEQTVDGAPIGIGRIVAAHLHHAGAEYYAFHFQQGDTSGYYDEEVVSKGKSGLLSIFRRK